MGVPSPMPGVQYPAPPGYGYPPPEPRRPTGAFVLSLIGGLLIFFGGIGEFLIGLEVGPFGAPTGPYAVFGLVAFALGVIIIVLAVLLHSHPDRHVGLGVAILILSIVSIVGGGGGILGLVLGVIGGALGIAFTPGPIVSFYGAWYLPAYYSQPPMAPMFYSAPWPPPAPPTAPTSPAPTDPLQAPSSTAYSAADRGRPCPKCGRLLPFGARFCSFCGSPAQ